MAGHLHLVRNNLCGRFYFSLVLKSSIFTIVGTHGKAMCQFSNCLCIPSDYSTVGVQLAIYTPYLPHSLCIYSIH